ncbi:MAG TPA: OmpA family protein [Rhizomicrobium sp.]|jgi:outer membrane protein OmpA-like peptidoglycan-associated protein
MKRLALLLFVLPFFITFADAAKHKPAAPTLPAYFTLPAAVTIPSDAYHYEDFGGADFWAKETSFTKEGHHWQTALIYNNPPAKAEGKDIWALIKPSLAASGWAFPDEYDSNPFSAMMHYTKDGKDVWAYMKIFGADDIRLNIVEVGAQTTTFTLPEPGVKPEKYDAKTGDFPWLLPLPGSKPGGGSKENGTMEVTLPGASEAQVVGNGYVVKYYKQPEGLSNLAFVTNYHDALTKAGWTIIYQTEGLSQTDSTVTAHYAKNGRDIWAYLHNGGEEYSIKVADNGGANEMAGALAKDCHVALLGVLFDFNKSTLKPQSDPVLQKVLALLQKDASLKLEVQGHTDNVGGDDYNQKLSEARAKSVMAWLTSHGVAPARLSFKGYGKTVPVATNDTDEGRAKNRRVEIAKPGCAKK